MQPNLWVKWNISLFVFLLGQRLNTTVYKHLTALSEFDCGAHCYHNTCCRSVNFRKIHWYDGRENCELLSSVVWEEPNNLKENAIYDHLVMVQPQRVSKL